MRSFAKNIFRSSNSETIALDPFDYIIITYQYSPPSGQDYDLDTITALRYQSDTLSGSDSANISGTLNSLPTVGCSGRFFTPAASTINSSYLVWGGDDVGQTQAGTFGESVVINFKNLELSGVTTSNDVVVDLYAGWHSGTSLYPISVKYETFTGGVISKEVVIVEGSSIETNRFVTTGTSIFLQTSNLKNITPGSCGAGVDGVQPKQKVASIFFNLLTKVSNVEFY